jgi:hypothetical protein
VGGALLSERRQRGVGGQSAPLRHFVEAAPRNRPFVRSTDRALGISSGTAGASGQSSDLPGWARQRGAWGEDRIARSTWRTWHALLHGRAGREVLARAHVAPSLGRLDCKVQWRRPPAWAANPLTWRSCRPPSRAGGHRGCRRRGARSPSGEMLRRERGGRGSGKGSTGWRRGPPTRGGGRSMAGRTPGRAGRRRPSRPKNEAGLQVSMSDAGNLCRITTEKRNDVVNVPARR